jgi:hypothetical protein
MAVSIHTQSVDLGLHPDDGCAYTRLLMSRWLYNIDAIRRWEENGRAGDIPWWPHGNISPYLIGDFVGQGRRMQYCGLASAVLKEATEAEIRSWGATTAHRIRSRVVQRLHSRPPSWYIIAIVSLVTVLIAVFSGFVVDYFTPTIGFGCWSASTSLYAILSTVSWSIQHVCIRPGWYARVVSHFFNIFAAIWLVILTGLYVSIDLLF